MTKTQEKVLQEYITMCSGESKYNYVAKCPQGFMISFRGHNAVIWSKREDIPDWIKVEDRSSYMGIDVGDLNDAIDLRSMDDMANKIKSDNGFRKWGYDSYAKFPLVFMTDEGSEVGFNYSYLKYAISMTGDKHPKRSQRQYSDPLVFQGDGFIFVMCPVRLSKMSKAI